MEVMARQTAPVLVGDEPLVRNVERIVEGVHVGVACLAERAALVGDALPLVLTVARNALIGADHRAGLLEARLDEPAHGVSISRTRVALLADVIGHGLVTERDLGLRMTQQEADVGLGLLPRSPSGWAMAIAALELLVPDVGRSERVPSLSPPRGQQEQRRHPREHPKNNTRYATRSHLNHPQRARV